MNNVYLVFKTSYVTHCGYASRYSRHSWRFRPVTLSSFQAALNAGVDFRRSIA